MDVWAAAEKIPLPQFGSRFNNFEVAFRLECLPEYRVTGEADAIKRFRENPANRPPDFNDDWISTLKAAQRRAAVVRRVRVLPEVPNEYLRFEFEWGYRTNAAFGEDIRYLEQKELIRSTLPCAIDYWLFDARDAFLMVYDSIGQFLGVVKADLAATNLLSKAASDLYAKSRGNIGTYFSNAE